MGLPGLGVMMQSADFMLAGGFSTGGETFCHMLLQGHSDY